MIATPVGHRGPLGYHSAFDHRSWRSIQIIEDLVATKGAGFCSPARFVSAERRSKSCVNWRRCMRKGTRLAARIQGPPTWLRTYPEWWRRALSVVGVKRSHLRGIAAAVDTVWCQRHFGPWKDLWEGFLRSVQDHRDLPATLIHGDVHLGNWYVTEAV